MSWVLRALIRSWRKGHRSACCRRPARLTEAHVRFGLYLYGDKSELMTWARLNGGEFGPFVRMVIAEWMAGRLEVDFDSVKTTKRVKSCRYTVSGIASDIQAESRFYSNREYWPKNSLTNLLLMLRGTQNRIYPLLPVCAGD